MARTTTRRSRYSLPRPLAWLPVLAWLVACGSPAGAPDTRTDGAGKPSVILVLIDALRPDHLGCYGYPRPVSPTIDRLAGESIVFEEARSVSSWTKPSVPSLFTSLYPLQHGVYEGDAHGRGGEVESDVLPEDAWTLAEALREQGYRTAAFVHNAQLRGAFGFAQGFSLYDEVSEAAPEMVARLLSWIDAGRAERPFFAYLHLLDVHWPYEPSAASARVLGIDPGTAGTDRALLTAVNQGLVELSAQRLQRLIDRYDGEIRDVDVALGRLVAALGERQLLDRVVLAITADHGEAFLEHGVLGHGGDLYEETVRIPLILRFPGARHGGVRVDAPVSLLDVMPTLIDLAGANVEGRHLEGTSLVPVIDGDRELGRELTGAEVRHGRTHRQAVWVGGEKLVRTLRRQAVRHGGVGTAIDPGSLVGLRMEVEGSRLEGDRFFPTEVETEDGHDDDDELTGVLEALDPASRQARLLGFDVEADRAVFLDGERRMLDPGALRSGDTVKVDGRAVSSRRFLAEKITLLRGEHETEIEGLVSAAGQGADPAHLELRIAGLRVPVSAEDLQLTDVGGRSSPTAAEATREPFRSRELELYDLRRDPSEQDDRSSSEPERVRRLLATLDRWEEERSVHALRRLPRMRLDEATLENLRALGYLP